MDDDLKKLLPGHHFGLEPNRTEANKYSAATTFDKIRHDGLILRGGTPEMIEALRAKGFTKLGGAPE
jgi:hypothetical protein